MAEDIGSKKLLDIDLIIKKAGIGAQMKAADFGCGSTGMLAFYLSSLVGEKGKIYAIDIQKIVLESLAKRIKAENIRNIELVWSDLDIVGAAKIESNSLDAVFIINSLYQSEQRANLLREAIRLTKKRGKIIIVDWQNSKSPIGPLPEHRVNPDSLKQGAAKLGLVLEDEFVAGPYHYGLILVK